MNLSKHESFISANLIQSAIASRKNYSAKRLVAPGPTQTQIEQIFGAASHAPDHGNETPWRFILIPEDKRHLLGNAFAEALLERDSKVSIEEVEKAKKKAFNSPLLVVAICKQLKATSLVTNSERLISLGCAIQNLLIYSTALGFGSGLTSGKAMNSNSIRQLFKIDSDEECICFINIGTVESEPKVLRIRPPLTKYFNTL